jgi:hypothetical protein
LDAKVEGVEPKWRVKVLGPFGVLSSRLDPPYPPYLPYPPLFKRKNTLHSLKRERERERKEVENDRDDL